MNNPVRWALLCLLAFVTILPAQTGSTVLTMTEVPFRPVDGLTVQGITFHFFVGGTPSTDAFYNSGNGGQLTYVQDPALEGNAAGVLVIDFASPVTRLQFGVARSGGALSPGLQVQLLDPALNTIGVFQVNTQVITFNSEALFVSPATQPVSRAVLAFPNFQAAARFAIDNLAATFIDNFQVRYTANLNVGDSVISLTNAGTQNIAAGALTNLCVNVYAFSPDEQLISCCTCTVTPNALVSLSARSDLISNTLTPAVPNSIVVKLLATAGSSCNAAAVSPANYAAGLAAWGTTLHATPGGTYAVTETAFRAAPLSAGELARITSFCGFIQANGSGYGICRSCRLGGQNGIRQ